MLFGKPLYFIIVDLTRIGVQPILHRVIKLSGKIDCRAVCEVSAMRKAHSEHRIARIQQSHIHGRVGA